MVGKIYIIVVAAICSILLRIQGFHSISISLSLALIYLLYQHRTNGKLQISFLVIFLFFYFNPYYFPTAPPLPLENSIRGKITSIPIFNGPNIKFELTSQNNETFQINYYAKTEQELNDVKSLKYGFKCSFTGTFKDPPQARNFYSFDYRSYLATRKIFFQFVPNYFSTTQCIETNQSTYHLLQRYRQMGINYIKEHFPDASKGMIISLIFGDRGELDADVQQSYQSLGIIHLLAVSGLHIGLVNTSLYFILIRIGMTKERTTELLIVLVPMYSIISGAEPSVIRASSMVIIVLISIRTRLKVSLLDNISVVCLGLLLVNPAYLFQIGFQLSFLVTYALLISGSTIFQRYSSRFWQLVSVTVVAQLISFPLVIYHFYEISLWSLPLNFVYIPFFTFFVMPLAFIIFFSHLFIPQISELLLVLYEFVLIYSHKGLEFINNLPFSSIVLGKPPPYLLVLYYVAIGFLFYLWESSTTKLAFIKGGMAFLTIVTWHWFLPYLKDTGEVTMIDVGQGDSIYLELPHRKAVYVIDTGGHVTFAQEADWQRKEKEFAVGEEILVPYLKAKGVRKIDKLILTHGHYDHIGGAEALLGNINVETLLYGAGPVEGELEQSLLQNFTENGTKIQFVKRGDKWKKNNIEFHVVAPVGGEMNLNDRSIVIYTKIGGLNWLFTGDLEANGESSLVNYYHSLNVDVLKVGHHGSNTSTTEQLLAATNPKIALISVGKGNRFGHPHPDTNSRLKDHNLKVFRTDQHGAIRYVFNGNEGTFQTVLNEER